MITVLAPESAKHAALLVTAALRRSVSLSQVELFSGEQIQAHTYGLVVAINPDKEITEHINKALSRNCRLKIILFGSLTEELMNLLDVQHRDWPSQLVAAACSKQALAGKYAESSARIHYNDLVWGLQAKSWQRPLERFDFTNEWNNLGYGAVRADKSDWSIAMPVEANESCSLAEISSYDFEGLAYSALRDLDHSSILWFNRANGPIDSFEWKVVEDFISNWRGSDLPCIPVIKEVPHGYDCCVTMRLDCDEDIESARDLRHEYHRLEVPFSLAIHTGNLQDPSQHQLIQEMSAEGESILSHSATHASNWGGSYTAAVEEASLSAMALKKLTGQSPKYAVSPFHQTPSFALQALADCGYSGCIGGIISCNPEFLIARGGELAKMPRRFIGHSQQHMLHGECLLDKEDPLETSKRAFNLAKETGMLFGYLDHPFSERYSYGWKDEASLINAHRDLILFIKRSTERPLFLSEDSALDFLQFKSGIQIVEHDQEFVVCFDDKTNTMSQNACIEYRGDKFLALNGLNLHKGTSNKTSL